MRTFCNLVVLLFFILTVSALMLCGDNPEGPDPSQNTPPATPSNPSPQNGAADQSIEVNLSWTCTDPDEADTLTYEVYLSTDSSPEYQRDITGTTYEPGSLIPNTIYFWKIIAKDNHGSSTIGPTWSFTTGVVPNSPPNSPDTPNPANGETGVPLTNTLSWNCSDPDIGDQLVYDVYFGTSQESLDLSSEQQDGISYSPELDSSTTYYWKIEAFDSHGESTEGPVWNFSTVAPANNPPNVPRMRQEAPDSGSTEQSLYSRLSWYCSDPDEDSLIYNVYFGTENPPPLISEMYDDDRYDPGMLDLATTYYWRIVAYDTHGDSTGGGLWYFTTQTTNPPVMIWYGNVNGESINTNVGEIFDIDVYLQTDSDVYVANILLCLGANQIYIDSLLSATEGVFYYPFDEWQVAYYNSIYEYEDGWYCEPFYGTATIFGQGTWLNFEVPTRGLTMRMKASNNSDLAGQTVEAFAPGEDPIQGPSNVGDTLGYNYNFREYFNLLHFNE